MKRLTSHLIGTSQTRRTSYSSRKETFRNFKPLDEGQDDPAYEVDKLIPTQARWYLILDMYGKKTDREVRVDFEEVKRS